MEPQPLKVLVVASAGETPALRAAIASAGHELRAAELEPRTAVRVLGAADVEIVVVSRTVGAPEALRLIGTLTHTASYPVVAALPEMDRPWVEDAVAAGASGVVVGHSADSFLIALRVAWQRCADYRALQEALERRAKIEQAKGLLMARYGITGDEAFEMLRQHSQRTNRKLVDMAAALVKSHAILGALGDRVEATPVRMPRRGTEPRLRDDRPA